MILGGIGFVLLVPIIRDVESRAFEYQARPTGNDTVHFAAALGADSQGVIYNRLKLLEFVSAVLTQILISRHYTLVLVVTIK